MTLTGPEIARVRRSYNMRVGDLAKRAGITGTYLQFLESGRRPGAKAITVLNRVLREFAMNRRPPL